MSCWQRRSIRFEQLSKLMIVIPNSAAEGGRERELTMPVNLLKRNQDLEHSPL